MPQKRAKRNLKVCHICQNQLYGRSHVIEHLQIDSRTNCFFKAGYRSFLRTDFCDKLVILMSEI